MTLTSKVSAKRNKENLQIRFAAIALIALVFIIFIVLIINPFEKELPTSPSLNDNWNLLEVNARNSYGDSYLTYVSIDINRKDPYLFSAEYHSASQPDVLLFVGIDYSSKIAVKPFTSPPLAQSSNTIPVYRKDWSIDSQEALNIFAKDETANSCLKSSKGIINLSLYKTQIIDGEFSVWRLSIFDCPEKGNLKDFYLDAKTGEVLDIYFQ